MKEQCSTYLHFERTQKFLGIPSPVGERTISLLLAHEQNARYVSMLRFFALACL